MAQSPSVSLTTDGAVATVMLTRPHALNALSTELMEALDAAIDRVVADGARALVLTGEGRFFCSGADLSSDGQGEGGWPDDLGALLETHYNPLIRKLADLPIPVVTALNGPAAGAGVSIALSGDIIVAAEGAYLLLAFVNIGLVPDAGATWLVARSVGRARALEMCLLGERISAADAKAAGLVTRVVADIDVLIEAQRVAARLAAGPRRAIGTIRRQVGFALDRDLDAVLGLERDNQRLMGRTEDFAEAIAAFGAKRKPNFRGQ